MEDVEFYEGEALVWLGMRYAELPLNKEGKPDLFRMPVLVNYTKEEKHPNVRFYNEHK